MMDEGRRPRRRTTMVDDRRDDGRNRRRTGRRRRRRRRRRRSSPVVIIVVFAVAMAIGGTTTSATTITLGDLEGVGPSFRPSPRRDDGADAIFGPNRREEDDEEDFEGGGGGGGGRGVSSDDDGVDLGRRRRRRPGIDLDLSGRVMCHAFSRRDGGGRDDGAGGAPLFSLPLPTRSSSSRRHRRGGRRGDVDVDVDVASPPSFRPLLLDLLPHDAYVGANYDFDEVWYGATRWIARCSWCRPAPDDVGPSSSSSLRALRDSADVVVGRLFPPLPTTTSSSSLWTIDVEGERGAFDRSDSTMRLGLVRYPDPRPSSSASRAVRIPTSSPPRRISLEYDSAKRYPTGEVRYAPAVAVDATTTLLHPRLEASVRRTWIVGGVGGGGDGDGNGDRRLPCVVRRLESIREGYREGVPGSNPVPVAAAATGSRTAMGGLGRRLSTWLENDGWMPKRVAVDLMGNLVSVSEVGLAGENDGGGESDVPTTTVRRRPSSWHGVVVPPLRGAGMRLRLSKRVDWTTLGVFPWSGGGGDDRRDGGPGGVFDALRSTRARLELCGLYGPGGEMRASVGFDVDPSDWAGTFKFTVRHEEVSVLGGVDYMERIG